MFHLNIFQVCDDYNSARHHYEEIDNNKYQVLTKPFFRFGDSDCLVPILEIIALLNTL